MKRHIPNGITLLNLLCGCIAVILTLNNNINTAAIFVFLGIFFDFLDGFVAKKLNSQSALGIQLDSLADLITSGLVPGVVMYKLLSIATHENVNHSEWTTNVNEISFSLPILPLIALLIPLASAYRLAKFNLDEDQQTYFKGLPTPANALLIISLPLIVQNHVGLGDFILKTWTLIIITLLSCYLLNSKLKLFALKFKQTTSIERIVKYGFIVLCLLLLGLLQFIAIPIIILSYIIVSIIYNIVSKQKDHD